MQGGKWIVFIFIYNSLHVSSTSCSSSGETNCVNTTSGNCHSVSVAVSCATGHGHPVDDISVVLYPVSHVYSVQNLSDIS